MIKYIGISLFSILLSFNAEACRQVNWDINEWAINSSAVYYGGVVSVKKSIPNLNRNLFENHLANDLATTEPKTKIELVVFEKLKGNKAERISAELN